MLIFSSCELEGRAAMPALEQPFTADAVLLALAARKHLPQTPEESWKVVQMDCDVDDAQSMNELLPLFQQARPLLLYLNGYNSTPAAFFERCDRLQSVYGLEIVRFSWSSQKHLLDDGFRPGFDMGMDLGLPRELARLFGPQAAALSRIRPEPLYSVACNPENVTCSWWVLMALPSVRH